MKEIRIRKLRKEDADEIAGIYGAITQKPVEIDFRRIVEKDSRRNDASFVAELEGKVVGFMTSYILTLGFGIEKKRMDRYPGCQP